MDSVATLEDEIEELTRQSEEIRKEFKKRKTELTIEYGESLIKGKGGPTINLIKKVFKKGLKNIGRAGNKIGTYASNKFEEHRVRENAKQEEYRASMANRRAEFTKYLAKKDGDVVHDEYRAEDNAKPIEKPKEQDAR